MNHLLPQSPKAISGNDTPGARTVIERVSRHTLSAKAESAPCGPGVMNAKSGSVKQGVERPFPIGESESPAPSQERGADFSSLRVKRRAESFCDGVSNAEKPVQLGQDS